MSESTPTPELKREREDDPTVCKRARTEIGDAGATPDGKQGASSTPTSPASSPASPATSAGGLRFKVDAACSEDKGRRNEMEDTWVIELDARRETNSNIRCSYFGVFDGHGGRNAADFAAERLHQGALTAGLLPTSTASTPTSSSANFSVGDAKKAIHETFKKTDAALLAESTTQGWQDGATAVCMWFVENTTAFVANVGDAKAVLARTTQPASSSANGSSSLKALTLTKEHKAIFAPERARIEKAGGQVSEGRLQGRVEVSRSFGDKIFKKVGMSAVPDIRSFKLSEADKFIIMGCDGFWGVFGPQDAVEFVDKYLKEGRQVKAVCNRILNEAIRERKCKDNCTVMIVVFSPLDTK